MSIKTLSPYYVSIPLVIPGAGSVTYNFTLKIYIWNGDKTEPPEEPAYTMTKVNATRSAGTEKVNIARIVNDFIEFECQPRENTGEISGNNQVWVKYECYYADATVAQFEETLLALKGYGYFLEGENPQLPEDKILLTGDEFKVSRNGRFVVPVLANESQFSGDEIYAKSYPLNEINYGVGFASSYISGRQVRYLWINVADAPTDEYIVVTYGNTRRTLLITDECRYTPIDIAFQNKEGALQVFTFFKAKKETISTTSENFESNRPIGGHQFIKYNVNAKTKFSVNSGFVTEDKNEAIRQLLLSERVWMLDGATAIPLNVTTSSQELKTRQNDRLINYAIEFEHAYYENNNV